MTRAYALIDWLMPVIVAIGVSAVCWEAPLLMYADLWERWAVLGGLVVAGVTAYWCGREHGGRRRG